LRYSLKWYIFYTIMAFEFDPGKSDRNLAKHGIDFVEAQRLWNDQNLLEIPARTKMNQGSSLSARSTPGTGQL